MSAWYTTNRNYKSLWDLSCANLDRIKRKKERSLKLCGIMLIIEFLSLAIFKIYGIDAEIALIYIINPFALSLFTKNL